MKPNWIELKPQLQRVWELSVPAILTQITTIAMQYIDSAMVGNLGAKASAAIGLVSTSTWLMGGVGSAVSAGFSVQVAQYIGANEEHNARRVAKHGFLTALIVSTLIALFGIGISAPLPRWLGGEEVLWKDASAYFLVFAITIPFMELNWLASGFLQSAGNMVVPSILNSVMCVLDVVFNAIFIHRYGVLGAAIGTGLATVVVCFVELWFCCLRYEPLRLNRNEKCPLDISILKRALKIGTPVGAESIAMCCASVVSTMIIAPLGAVAIAAHSFAITAESLCYMPGYGIATAASTLVGQSIGAKDHRLARRYGYITVAFGISPTHTCRRSADSCRTDFANWTDRGTALRCIHGFLRSTARCGRYSGAKHFKFVQHLGCTPRPCVDSRTALRYSWHVDSHGCGTVRTWSASFLPSNSVQILAPVR